MVLARATLSNTAATAMPSWTRHSVFNAFSSAYCRNTYHTIVLELVDTGPAMSGVLLLLLSTAAGSNYSSDGSYGITSLAMTPTRKLISLQDLPRDGWLFSLG